MTSIAIDRLDGLSSSTAIKGPCRVATIANVLLTGLQTIDGVVLASGDRVLVVAQTAPTENGIYVVDTGPWRRAKDFSSNKDVRKGTLIFVTDGTLHANDEFIVTSENPIVIGTSSITITESPNSIVGGLPTTANRYIQRNAAGTAYVALTALQSSNLDLLRDTTATATGLSILSAANGGAVATLIGAVTLTNNGISLSGATAANNFNPGAFGGLFLSGKTLHSLALDHTGSDATTGPRFAVAVTHEMTGGHANGPDSQRGGVWLYVGKKSYLTTTETGEIDAMYIQVRQGNKDDAGGILIDAAKVFAGGATGGLTPIELVGARVDASGTQLSAVHGVICFQEGAGGALNAGGASFYAENYTNANNQGFVAVNYTASFTRAFAAYNSRNNADDYFGVYYDGAANMQLGSKTDNIHLVFDFAADTMYMRDNTAAQNLFSLTKSGQLSAFAGMRVASGSTLITKMLKQTAALDFPNTLAQNSTSLTVTVTGAVVGDLCVVCPDTTYAAGTLFFTGRVTSANTVTVTMHNFSTAAIDPASQNVIILVVGG